tara:strand:- start:289 stop:483 length:195 start_codon:yes stop_codon:yes gene_type:complete
MGTINYSNREVELIVQKCRNEFYFVIEEIITTEGDGFDQIVYKINNVADLILSGIKSGSIKEEI